MQTLQTNPSIKKERISAKVGIDLGDNKVGSYFELYKRDLKIVS